MLKHTFVLGLAVVGMMLASPCQAKLINPNADVLYHPSGQPTSEQTLTNQIQGTSVAVSGAHSNDKPVPPQPEDFFADTHTVVFGDLLTGQSGIFALDQFNPNRTLNNDGTTAITHLQGVLLYFTVQLKTGRQVFDNQSNKEVSKAILEIGANVNVWSKNADIADSVNFSASPTVRKSGILAPDVDDPNNGFPSDITDLTEINAHSTGLDKLAVIIDPSDPNTLGDVNEIHVDATSSSSNLLAAFTGTGTVEFGYNSSLNTHHQVNSQGVIGWTIQPTYDIEARVVYLYSAIPEPASMSLLTIGVFSVLAKRKRKRKRKGKGKMRLS